MTVGLYLGHNPAMDILNAGNIFCDNQTTLILEHNRTNDKQISDLNKLNDFLDTLRADRIQHKDQIDWTNDQGKLEMLEEIGKLCPGLFPAGQCKWAKEEINMLEDSIMNKQKLILTTFNPNMMEIEQLFQDRNRVVDIIAEILKEYREGTRVFVHNQRKQ